MLTFKIYSFLLQCTNIFPTQITIYHFFFIIGYFRAYLEFDLGNGDSTHWHGRAAVLTFGASYQQHAQNISFSFLFYRHKKKVLLKKIYFFEKSKSMLFCVYSISPYFWYHYLLNCHGYKKPSGIVAFCSYSNALNALFECFRWKIKGTT